MSGTPQEEFFALAAAILRSETAALIGKRLALLANSAFLPDSGSGDSHAVAAFMSLAEVSTDELLTRNQVPGRMPGKRKLYRFADILASCDPKTRRRMTGKRGAK
jgi:hypothetical protein